MVMVACLSGIWSSVAVMVKAVEISPGCKVIDDGMPVIWSWSLSLRVMMICSVTVLSEVILIWAVWPSLKLSCLGVMLKTGVSLAGIVIMACLAWPIWAKPVTSLNVMVMTVDLSGSWSSVAVMVKTVEISSSDRMIAGGIPVIWSWLSWSKVMMICSVTVWSAVIVSWVVWPRLS